MLPAHQTSFVCLKRALKKFHQRGSRGSFFVNFFFFSTAKNGESLGDMAGVTAACLFFYLFFILAYLLIFKSWLMQRQR